LTLEDERRLTRALAEAEKDMVRALVLAPGGLRAFAARGEEVRAGRLEVEELVRFAARAQVAASDARDGLLAVLERAGGLAKRRKAESDIGTFADELAALCFQGRVLERIGASLTDASDGARRAFEDARRRADRAKAEWAALSTYLVMAIARRYGRPGVDQVDLIQEGSIGLLSAIERFDASLGHRFPPYAAWWIRQHIFRAIAGQARTIRVPLPMLELLHRTARARRLYAVLHGYEPDARQLAAASGMKLQAILNASAVVDEPVSLQSPVAGREMTVLDGLADLSVPAPDEEVAQATLHAKVRSLFSALSPCEKDILARRFGLDGEGERSLVDVAEALGLSRDRVRRMEERALAKLRRWSVRAGLRAA
jgi:RNA polymerase sigma factor (sigma-70 family)